MIKLSYHPVPPEILDAQAAHKAATGHDAYMVNISPAYPHRIDLWCLDCTHERPPQAPPPIEKIN